MLNHTKEKLQKDLPAFGYWLSLPSPTVAEIMSGYGMDWILIDTEHGVAGYDLVEQLLRGMKGTPVTPLIRVAANDVALIKKALDRGAYGVLVPFVNNAAEAAAAVAACRYPPAGIRGVAGTRASTYGATLPAYLQSWNEEVLVAVQIETRQAVEQAEAIAAVPGIDVLFLGPNDLSASLGIFQQFDHPEFKQAAANIVQAARKHGKAAGYMAFSPESALARIDDGFRFVAAGSDARVLMNGLQTAVQQMQTGLAERQG